MSRPYDFIYGQKIDLNNDEHRKIVVERNKKLEKFTSEKTELHEASPIITIEATIKCFKCGSEVTSRNYLDANNLEDTVGEQFDYFQCRECLSTYERLLFKDEFIFKTNQDEK